MSGPVHFIQSAPQMRPGRPQRPPPCLCLHSSPCAAAASAAAGFARYTLAIAPSCSRSDVPPRPPMYPYRPRFETSNVVICRMIWYSCDTASTDVHDSCSVAHAAVATRNGSNGAPRHSTVEKSHSDVLFGSIGAASGAFSVMSGWSASSLRQATHRQWSGGQRSLRRRSTPGRSRGNSGGCCIRLRVSHYLWKQTATYHSSRSTGSGGRSGRRSGCTSCSASSAAACAPCKRCSSWCRSGGPRP